MYGCEGVQVNVGVNVDKDYMHVNVHVNVVPEYGVGQRRRLHTQCSLLSYQTHTHIKIGTHLSDRHNHTPGVLGPRLSSIT